MGTVVEDSLRRVDLEPLPRLIDRMASTLHRSSLRGATTGAGHGRSRGARGPFATKVLSRRGALGHHEGTSQLNTWAGRLVVFYGAAHTLGALTLEGAGSHAGAWVGRELWGGDLSEMSPAMSAYWLSLNSFGPPLVLLGLTMLWLDRRGLAPPSFIAGSLAAWLAIGLVVVGPGSGQDLILLVACGLLLAGARRARQPQRLPSEVGGHPAGR